MLSQPQSFHDRRIKGIGGSEVAAVLGISPWKTAYQLWLEKTKRTVPEDISHMPHVVRGILGEKTARMILERDMLKAFIPKTWQGEKEWHLCSDDGWNLDDNVILEIKCQGADKHAKAKDGFIPEYYKCQIQWNLFVSKAAHCIFISFRPEDETLYKIIVYPDKDEQEKILAAVDNFWLNYVVKDVQPPLAETDYHDVKNETLSELVKQYAELLGQSKTIEAKIEDLKEKIKPYTATQRAIQCDGVKILRSETSGRIDYKKYFADKSVDLEAYRGKPVETFKIFVPTKILTF